jgi:hypothetical protein
VYNKPWILEFWGFQSIVIKDFNPPPDVILLYVVTGSTCCKGTCCAFVFVKGLASLYVQQSVTFQRPVGLFLNNEFLSCDIEEARLSISDDIWYDIFDCDWVAIRWQYIAHIHRNNTENDTKQTVHRTTQKTHKTTQKLRRVRAVPRLCGFYPGICLTTEEKARKNLSQGSHT